MLDERIVQEVRNAVIERGRLSKGDIIETWGLTEEEYDELTRHMGDGLDDFPPAEGEDTELWERAVASGYVIHRGPKKTGGFVAQVKGQRTREESSNERWLLRTDWEKRSVERLGELLTGHQLKVLLGALQFAVRNLRRREIGVDSSTKRDLATALILQHGIDLFCEPAIRRQVAAACKVRYPKRWHPGKGAAVEFVAQVAFPRELAGIPSPESLPDYEYLEGRFDLRPLESFQKEVKAQLDCALESIGGRAIVTLPTGAGKTRVAVESIRDWLTHRWSISDKVAKEAGVLWLAHTEELCEQAHACFRQVWTNSENVCPLLLMRFWGHYTHDLTKHASVLQL